MHLWSPGPPERNANIHVVSQGCTEIERWLTFRDRIRGNEADRELYARTKRELAGQRWRDTDAYAEAKSEVVERIIASARAVDGTSGQVDTPCRGVGTAQVTLA
jgi:GrpB-like predicted nucleotidyltransferase (UPF0157 family)